ncbi:MAG: cytochrome c oxidase assembly protein [Caulobacteraceae bacterium]|nr:cytochrome c oxidase assembly protein [Caulobacteraceae bacterium]
MLPAAPSDPTSRRNRKVALVCAGVFAAMVGAAFAAVPLYRAFCQVTGFGGTTQRAAAPSRVVLDKTLTVRFDTNVRDVPLQFTAEQVSQELKIGATGLAFFKVTNTSDKPVTTRAIYNVVPESAGPYFQKLQCFCFTEQTIAPGRTMEFPMVYFVDPGYASDFETKGQREVTLSYTFFPAEGPVQADASSVKGREPLGGSQSAGL